MPYFLQSAEPGVLVILVRHGSTLANNPKQTEVRGWMDSPLSPKGKLEAQLAGQKLRPYQPQYIFSSDFMRDTETAHIIAGQLNVSALETDFDARTWDTGLYSGKLETEVNPAIIELYKRSWEAPPGSEESFDQFSARWQGFLDGKMQFARSFRPTVIVTHGRNIALSQAYFDQIQPLDCFMPLPAGFATVTVKDDRSLQFDIVSEKEPVIEDV